MTSSTFLDSARADPSVVSNLRSVSPDPLSHREVPIDFARPPLSGATPLINRFFRREWIVATTLNPAAFIHELPKTLNSTERYYVVDDSAKALIDDSHKSVNRIGHSLTGNYCAMVELGAAYSYKDYNITGGHIPGVGDVPFFFNPNLDHEAYNPLSGRFSRNEVLDLIQQVLNTIKAKLMYISHCYDANDDSQLFVERALADTDAHGYVNASVPGFATIVSQEVYQALSEHGSPLRRSYAPNIQSKFGGFEPMSDSDDDNASNPITRMVPVHFSLVHAHPSSTVVEVSSDSGSEDSFIAWSEIDHDEELSNVLYSHINRDNSPDLSSRDIVEVANSLHDITPPPQSIPPQPHSVQVHFSHAEPIAEPQPLPATFTPAILINDDGEAVISEPLRELIKKAYDRGADDLLKAVASSLESAFEDDRYPKDDSSPSSPSPAPSSHSIPPIETLIDRGEGPSRIPYHSHASPLHISDYPASHVFPPRDPRPVHRSPAPSGSLDRVASTNNRFSPYRRECRRRY
jgi:hypothetical protein